MEQFRDSLECTTSAEGPRLACQGSLILASQPSGDGCGSTTAGLLGCTATLLLACEQHCCSACENPWFSASQKKYSFSVDSKSPSLSSNITAICYNKIIS